MDMKPLRYSSLFALSLAGVLLVALKSNALIQYWQQSRHILLDVAPPPAVSDLLGEYLFSADLAAPFVDAEQWLLAAGQAPWAGAEQTDPEELAATAAQLADDNAVVAEPNARPNTVKTAGDSVKPEMSTVPNPATVNQTNADKISDNNVDRISDTKLTTTKNVDAAQASDATARLIAQTNGSTPAADTSATASQTASTQATADIALQASTQATTNATLNSLDAMGNIELEPQDRVLLIGDSLMQGLAPHLVARFKKKDQIQTVDMSRHSTGLTYPAFYNWPNAVQKAFSEQSYDVMIVFMGANDPWDMTVKGKYIRFASTRWNEIYSERVRTILQIASDHNTRVIWLSTPPMGRDDIKGKIPQLNQLYKAEIAKFASTARFIDTAPVLTTDGVSYSRFIELPERGSVMLRTDDGIHFTTQGHRLLSKLTLAQFRLPQPKKSP